MSKEKKTRMVKLEKHDPDTYPMIVGKVKTSIPKMRTVKLKEKFKVATSKSNSTSASVTTCETSGNIRKLCVNLMPFLAAAKEPAEEEEGNEEDKSSTSKNGPETSNKNEAPSVTKSVEQTLNSFIGLTLDTDTKQLVNPHFVLPPISQSKSAPECCDHQKNLAPQPPISLSEQTRTISSNFSIKCCGGGGLVTGQVADSRPWIDNPLFSKSRSPEFSLPDISLSSLDALLQTVTQKLGRKRRGFDEGSWGRIQSNHLLMAVSEQRFRERSITGNRNLVNIKTIKETSLGGSRVTRQRSLPPLSSAPKQMLILNMTKKNIPTSNMLQ
ncbi:uncharacterized protein LOC116694876 [Etheostoma spectabile]|uniref:uncharacterized protein LOC116694876 n=1 Tax=Etheostoma spectabile TaxID=54343 RepID=UPI0013AF846D|nr:uncharacterized protein LOC116694876 [Etheostoma spectabile]